MRAERRRVETEIDLLLADSALHIGDPLQEALWTNFYLAFHGENNRELQIMYATSATFWRFPDQHDSQKKCSLPNQRTKIK